MHMFGNKNDLHHELVGKADRLYQRGLCDAAVDLLLGGIKKCSCETNLYHALAEILIDSEQYQDAFDIINKLPSHAKDRRVLELLGCKFGLELLEEADAIACQVMEPYPESAPALDLKGLLAHKQSNNSAAEEFFRKAIAANPEYGAPYTHLGTLRFEDSRSSEALDFFEKGFMRAPTAANSVLGYH